MGLSKGSECSYTDVKTAFSTTSAENNQKNRLVADNQLDSSLKESCCFSIAASLINFQAILDPAKNVKKG
jgi:hypothetical protein